MRLLLFISIIPAEMSNNLLKISELTSQRAQAEIQAFPNHYTSLKIAAFPVAT